MVHIVRHPPLKGVCLKTERLGRDLNGSIS